MLKMEITGRLFYALRKKDTWIYVENYSTRELRSITETWAGGRPYCGLPIKVSN